MVVHAARTAGAGQLDKKQRRQLARVLVVLNALLWYWTLPKVGRSAGSDPWVQGRHHWGR